MGRRKTTVWQILRSKEALDKLVQVPFDASIIFDLTEIVEIANQHLERYSTTLQATLKKYNVDEDILDDPDQDRETYKKITTELEPVLNKEITFDLGITRDMIKQSLKEVQQTNIKMSVNEILSLKWLYTPIE